MNREIKVGDYVHRTRPPSSYNNEPPTVVYLVMRLLNINGVRHAQVHRCNFRTLTVVPGSKFFKMPVDRLFCMDPLEVMARWGKERT